jgi:hypothetical protein
MKNKLNSKDIVEKDVSIKAMKMNKLQLKEALMKKIEVTHFLDHKEKSEIPFVSPVATTYKKEFQNYSQKKRYEKIKQKLLELKMVLENDEDNEIKIVKEVRKFITKFLFKNGIIEESAYELERINNFIRFIKSDMSNLTLNLSLKQVIDLASFGYFDKKDEKKGKNNNTDEKNKSKWHSKTNNEMFTNYRSSLENFEKSNKFNKNDEKDLISKLSDELNNPKFHVDINKTQGITRFKSLNNSFLIDHKKEMKSNGEIDKNTNINDLEKIRKNNKLLELIVVNLILL